MATELPCQTPKTYATLVEDILEQIVKNEDDLYVDEVKDPNFNGKSIWLQIRCHKDDRGKVIGTKGKCIGAINTLITAMTEGRYRVKVELVDD